MELKDKVIAEIKKIYDPEIPVNIYELGLIYDIIVDDKNNVKIDMTLTSPNCPAAEILPMEIEFATRAVEGVNGVKVTLTFNPPWNPDAISDEGKYQMGIL